MALSKSELKKYLDDLLPSGKGLIKTDDTEEITNYLFSCDPDPESNDGSLCQDFITFTDEYTDEDSTVTEIFNELIDSAKSLNIDIEE